TWSRLSALRFPTIAASLALVPGAGLLVAGLAGIATDGPSRFAIGAVGATAGALIHLIWQRRPSPTEPGDGSRRRVLPFASVLHQAASMNRAPELFIVVIAGALAGLSALVSLALPLQSSSLDVVRPLALLVLALTASAHAIL